MGLNTEQSLKLRASKGLTNQEKDRKEIIPKEKKDEKRQAKTALKTTLYGYSVTPVTI